MILRRVVVTMMLIWALPGWAADEIINKKSPYSVGKTLDRLENIVKTKGITVFARIDHGAGAISVGKPLHASELLIFGNPNMGTPLMQEAPLMGLELPMKALAWQDASDQVWLSYMNPAVLKQRHNISNSAVISKMTQALNAMTEQVVAR